MFSDSLTTDEPMQGTSSGRDDGVISERETASPSWGKQTILRSAPPIRFRPAPVAAPKTYGNKGVGRTTQYIMHPSGRKLVSTPMPARVRSVPVNKFSVPSSPPPLTLQPSVLTKGLSGITVIRPQSNVRYVSSPTNNRSLLAPMGAVIKSPGGGKQFIKISPHSGQSMKILGRDEGRKNVVVVKRSAGAVSTKLAVSTTDASGAQRVQFIEGWTSPVEGLKNPRSLIPNNFRQEAAKRAKITIASPQPRQKEPEPEPELLELSDESPDSPPTFTGVEDYLFGPIKKTKRPEVTATVQPAKTQSPQQPQPPKLPTPQQQLTVKTPTPQQTKLLQPQQLSVVKPLSPHQQQPSTLPPPQKEQPVKAPSPELEQIEEDSKEPNLDKDAVEEEAQKKEVAEEPVKAVEKVVKPSVQMSEEEKKVLGCLDWAGSVGALHGSDFEFKINEFGVLELIEEQAVSEKKESGPLTQEVPPLKRQKGDRRDELLKCEFCGTYGMGSEFISGRFCGKVCLEQREIARTEQKRKLLEREQRKLVLRLRRQQLVQQRCLLEGFGAEQAQEVVEHELQRVRMERELLKLEDSDLLGSIKEGSENSRNNYMSKVIVQAAPLALFRDPIPSAKTAFKVGMKLEAIDPVRPSLYCVCTIAEVQGYRLKLHFDGYPHCHDFWVNSNSTEIFHPGWCERTDHKLTPPRGYEGPFNWTLYLESLKAIAAPRHAFLHPQERTITPSGFRVGMKLEAVDKKNSRLVCVASIADVIESRILVHFDGWEDIYDFWAENNSPYIHPAGWCEENGYELHAPPDYPRLFRWDEYTTEEKGFIAPARAFKHRPPYEFKKGMKLEAVDKRNPSLIRLATVADTEFYQIKIKFDGWPDQYAYWVDDDCQDIHPIGWCSATSHPLTAPPTYAELDPPPGECRTPGCTGVGHALNIAPNHVSVATCPYSPANYLNDELIPDRFPSTAEYHSAKKSSYSKGTKPRNLLSRKVRLLDHKKPSQKLKRMKVESAPSPPLPPQTMKKEEEPHFLAKFKKEMGEKIAGLCANPRVWSTEEVEKFIREFLTEDKGRLFLENDIDGEALLMLSQNDLTEHLSFKLGPAIKLYNCIRVLRQQALQYD